MVVLRALYDPNVIAIALKGLPARIEWQKLQARARELEARLGLPFPRYVSRLKGMNSFNATELLIVPE